RVMSRYAQGIMARLYKHSDILEIAANSSVPVINGLTDLEHPCQAMADLLTMKENGKLGNGKRFAFVGDCGFNMANSLMLACAKFGMDVSLVCPESCKPNMTFVNEASKFAKVEICHDIEKGVEGADVIYTDVWVSMGMEAEAEARLEEYAPFQVNSKLLSYAKKDCVVMHCLPANRGQEITNGVIDGPNSVVWDQAENRLHFQKALMLDLMAHKKD
ncbi:MAG TPA: ornithine carbamoyltransferase, partial [Candidatus Micrarchaeota archaeon]|nr:ornithine carbamoyltransferase [Candidatus Micrarchaeota archaeon]